MKPYQLSFVKWHLFLLFLIIGLPLAAKPDDRQSQPAINISVQHLPDFREVIAGHFSDVQYYYVAGIGLEASLDIVAEAPFMVSLDCHEGFASALSLPHNDGQVDETRVYIRLFAEAVGSFTGSIIHTSESADQQSLSVSGSGVNSFIPEDYYTTATDAGSRLKTQLHHIISNHSVQSYASLWTHFAATDATFDGLVWDIYSHTLCEEPPYTFTFFDDQDSGTGGTAEGDVYNREHTMPRSWFGGQVNPMNTDLYHIYPVDKWVNARRAAFPYGMVDNAGWTSLIGGKLGPNVAGGYNGTAFEPVDEYKGDLARAFFYMITRYEDQISNWTFSEYGNAVLDHQTYPGYEPWVMQMLITWHESDPVSQKEVLRNHDVYQIQGNRNPFVDHPEFVHKIWGDTTVYAGNPPVAPRITMYPNPAREFLSIETPGEVITLQVFNTSGELVLNMATSSSLVRLNVRKWKSGVYVLRIKGTVWTETHRIIIL